MNTSDVNQILEKFLYSRQAIIIRQLEFLKDVSGGNITNNLLLVELEEINQQLEKLNK